MILNDTTVQKINCKKVQKLKWKYGRQNCYRLTFSNVKKTIKHNYVTHLSKTNYYSNILTVTHTHHVTSHTHTHHITSHTHTHTTFAHIHIYTHMYTYSHTHAKTRTLVLISSFTCFDLDDQHNYLSILVTPNWIRPS